MSSVAPSVPSKDFMPVACTTGNTHELNTSPVEWRNSLLAIDDESGKVIEILAREVPIASYEDNAGIIVDAKNSQLEYTTAHTYHDDDVRPASRATSVLRENTFAPPPVPSKAEIHQFSTTDTGFKTMEEVDTIDGEVYDGKIKVALAHVETHRPELLRDLDNNIDKNHLQEASGSTIGGPIVQLWRKAKGDKDKKLSRKNKMKRAEKPVTTPLDHEELMQHTAKLELPSLDSSHDITNQELRSKARSLAQQSSIWDDFSTKSIMSHHLPGHSVLINFLSGSRISATIVDTLNIRPSTATPSAERLSPLEHSANTLFSSERNSQSSLLSFIPMLPGHLLSYFGLTTSKQDQITPPLESESTSQSYAGSHLVTLSKALSPLPLIMSASSMISNVGVSLVAWISLDPTPVPPEKTTEDERERQSKGDVDDQWEWTIPSYDPNSLESTPRPAYRRRKVVPSPKGHFIAHSTADDSFSTEGHNRYSIVHFDQWGVVRKAFTKV